MFKSNVKFTFKFLTYSIMPRHRSIYQHDTKMIYKAEISPDLNCLLCMKSPCKPCSCLCFPTVSAKTTESAYFHVYSNRIEYNYPTSTITWDCSCIIVDDVKTIYFDRNQLDDIYALEGCCCGYDRTVVLRRPCTSCSDVNVHSCCGRVYLPCIEEASTLVSKIIEQKTQMIQPVTDMQR
jgi:hypothetical protein